MGERTKEFNRAMGARVKLAREQRGMSQNELAKIVGLGDGQALSKYERGERGFSPIQLGTIADTFGLTTDWLAHGKERAQRKAEALQQPTSPKSTQEVHAALAAIGVRVDTDPTIPAPVLELINLGWLKPITNDDIQHLRFHLAKGGSSLPHDLLLAVWANRLQLDGSEENFQGLADANRRRAEAHGGKRITEHESASRSYATQEAANDEQRSKALPPRPKRRK